MRLISQKELTPVVYGEVPVKCFRQTAAAGELVFSLHWHDRVELHRVIAGEFTLFCGDEQTTVSAGEVSVISPRLLHRGVAGAGGVTYDVVMFDAAALMHRAAASWLKPLENGTDIFKIKTADTHVVQMVDALTALYETPNGHSLELLGSVYRLLGSLYRFVGVNTAPPPLEEKFSHAIAYINEQFTTPISTATLSRRFGYDEAYFCRKFKKLTGMTVMRYIRQLRLEQARALLCETPQAVSDVAAACGFADAAYFANCFKEQYGISPSKVKTVTK